MKIGIFGDSFAHKDWKQRIWWRELATMGHDITSYGEGGSSILFSALHVDKYAENYDFNIWVVSAPGRISFVREHSDNFLHAIAPARATTWTSHTDFTPLEERKLNAVKEWFVYLMDFEQETLIGESVARWLLAKHKNLMLVPGFSQPLSDTTFNLRAVSDWELTAYLSDSEIKKFYDNYIDQRAAHLSDENNKILAELINQNLNPGSIFQTEYSNFRIPTVPFNNIGIKKP